MFRIAFVCGMATALLFALVSCESGQPTSFEEPNPPAGLTAQIVGLNRAITAREGSLQVAAFDVLVTGSDSLPTSGVSVQIRVLYGPGVVVPETGISNNSGLVDALYYAILPFGDTSAVIQATAGGDTVSATIHITGAPAPVSIRLTSSPDSFNLHYSQPKSGELIVSVSDTRGNGVSDQVVALSVVQSKIQLQPHTRTNSHGEARLRIEIPGDIAEDPIITGAVLNLEHPVRYLPRNLPASLPFLRDNEDRPVSDTLRIHIAPNRYSASDNRLDEVK